jgi:hypothetical protein
MVHVMQLLCQRRHCIVAISYDDREMHREGAETALQSLVAKVKPGPCAICGLSEFHIEDGTTPFETLDEARPELERLEALQFLSRQAIRARHGEN